MTRSAVFRRPVLQLLAALVVFTGIGAKKEVRTEAAAPSRLTVNGIAAPVDLDVTPRFGWHVNSAEQTAYEIRVSSTRAKADVMEGDVWTSGRVASASQNDIRYEGPELAASERRFWAVRTWGAEGEVSSWSSVASFGTGPGASWSSSTPIWASPVGANENVDWAFLRKDFSLTDKPIAWATAYATGSSPAPAKQYVYKLYLNGAFVGLGPTQSIGSEIRYDGFDVTDRLTPGGANALGVIAYTTSGQAFQAELVVTYTDGSREVIGTDRTWRGLSGELAFVAAGSIGTSYYAAPKENVDARYFPDGFDLPGFDDSTWNDASEKPAIGELAAAPMAKVGEQLHAPVAIVEKGPGHYFVDFGRTWIGGLEYEIDAGSAGSIVDVRFAEVTSAANTVRFQLNTGNYYQDRYTLRDGSQILETWGMRVFRYVEIVGAPEPVTSENLAALALVYPFDVAAATFAASDTHLERVWQLSKNTIEALNVNFYVDSWTRERTNYEADAYLQLLSTLYLVDDLSLGRYSIDYFESHRTWPTEWPLYVILAVHDAWRQTGETGQLQAAYARLKTKLPEAWSENETQLVRKTTGSNGCDSVNDCDIVDWPQSQRDGYVFRQYNTVINALSYRAYRDMAAMATAIGEVADAATYTDRADRLRAAINSRLYVAEIGRYDDGMDANGALTGHYAVHSSAFALAFGVPEEGEAPRVADYLASRGMAGSVYSAPFLANGLYRAGNGQAALDLLTSTGIASWMNMIALGAGATAEAWDPSMKSNLTFSHPWAASPAFIVPSGLFGIQPLDAGYATFRVRPQPGALERASVTVPTVRGRIGAAFSYSPSRAFQLRVLVPGNTKADVSIPVVDGTTQLYVDQTPYAVEPQNGYATVFGLGAGCHVVTAEADGRAFEDETLLSACSAAPVDGGDASEPVSPALGPTGAPTTDASSASRGVAANGDASSGGAPSSVAPNRGVSSAGVSSGDASESARTAATCSMW
jgi:hypothetical protein